MHIEMYWDISNLRLAQELIKTSFIIVRMRKSSKDKQNSHDSDSLVIKHSEWQHAYGFSLFHIAIKVVV